MAKPRHDWYVKQWLAFYGKKQVAVVKELGWNKAKISLMARGEQPYTREEINEISAWLNIEPFELLLPPERAMSLRRFPEAALKVVEHSQPPIEAFLKTGTNDS